MSRLTLDRRGAPLDPFWVAEFRGFFFGDGFLGIVRNGRNRWGGDYPAFTARAQITLRDDDAAMLYDIEARLGGGVYGDSYAGRRRGLDRRPVMVWRTRSNADVAKVCDLLEGSAMPSKKLKEVAVMRRYLAIVIPAGRPAIPVDRAALYRQREACLVEMQRLHAYPLEFSHGSAPRLA